MASSNRLVWFETFVRYHLTRPEEGKQIKRYIWVGQAGPEYLLCDTTGIYESSPFEVSLPQSVQPSYVSEDPIRFREAGPANSAADHLYARLISEGWQVYSGEALKHKQE